jgi:predicted metalloendopeptidase
MDCLPREIEMKKNSFCTLVTLLAISSLSLFTACSKDEVEEIPSATDPYPYPADYTANKDLSVHPGDSFYDYCNGTWLMNHPIPDDPNKTLGGIYAAKEAMEERVEEVKKSVPDISHFFTLTDHMHDYSKESRDYITAQMAKYKKPATKEEAYRTLGKMFKDGIDVVNLSLIWDKDKLKAVILPASKVIDTEQYIQQLQSQERRSLSVTRAGGGETALTLLAEGMGIDPTMLQMSEAEILQWNDVWESCTLDDLYQMMQDSWLFYKAYADEAGMAEYNKTLPGEQQATLKSLSNHARLGLNYVMSYHLQQKYLPQSLKDKYVNITKEIQSALRKRIERVEWMSETTKNNAIDKLNHCRMCVAFPDTWHKECLPALADCKTLVEALHRLKAANAQLMTKLVGTDDIFTDRLMGAMKSSSGDLMPTDLSLVNALYMPSDNSITIYPAMLLSPLMPSDNVSEACYYAVFSIIGHEFTHGFDNNGSEWDKYGAHKNWWTVADRMNFEERSANLVSTFNLLELDPERDPLFFCDGKRTLGENIADLGGFLAALDAYQMRLDQQGFTGEIRNEQLRKFYESYAHLWCVQYGQNTFEILKYKDVHAHGRLRVNGVVMNTDSWYNLYNVNQNHLLYLPVNRRAYIW